LFGSIADRRGYRLIMRAGLVTIAIGLALIVLGPNLWLIGLGFLLAGLGAGAFVPNLQAYMSARLPYAVRARGMGMIEYSWALASLVMLSLMGLLIEAAGWRAPFYVLIVLLLVMAWRIGALPQARNPQPDADAAPARGGGSGGGILSFFYLQTNARPAYLMILATSFSYFAATQFMILHGAWFADTYGLGATELGMVALVFGIFDLTASVSVSLFADRIGKRRSLLFGLTGSMLGYILIPFLNSSFWPAVIGAALARGLFEFSIVSGIPILSEFSPTQRGKVMTMTSALSLVAYTLSAVISPVLYGSAGVTGLAIVSAIAAAVSLVLVLAYVQEPVAVGE
jgi:predicted MFS family arabinose efflux permease